MKRGQGNKGVFLLFIFSLSSSDHCDANQNFLHSTSTLQNLQGKTPVNLLTIGGGGGGGDGNCCMEHSLVIVNRKQGGQ